MKITRIGAAANHGARSIVIGNLKFGWQVGSDTMKVKSPSSIRDFATESHHVYEIQFDAEEVGSLIQSLASSANNIDSDVIRSVFRHRVPDLIKLANLASNT